jgi:predicted RNase H-like HicB family nuclease
MPQVSAKLDYAIHRAEEGGYWAEVPALPGCFTQAETLAELRRNVREAVELYLDAAPPAPKAAKGLPGKAEATTPRLRPKRASASPISRKP